VTTDRARHVEVVHALLIALSFAAGGCATTEVAIITVRNETSAELAVQPRLHGQGELDEAVTLRPSEERVMIKYEEPPSRPTPVSRYIEGLRVTTAARCEGALDSSAVTGAAERSRDRRRWTIRLTSQLLRTLACP
jgi:type II secretory pathway predicted ATPase ExeA